MLKVGNRKGRGRSRTSSTIASNEAKCVARICKYTGINTSNKNAVGVCTKCALFEHFDCSKTSSEDRDEILKGSLQYIYTLCFLKNPSQVTVIPEAINREKISSVCKAIEGPSTSSDPFNVHNCTFYSFNSNDKKTLEIHMKDRHEFNGGDEVFHDDERNSDDNDRSCINTESEIENTRDLTEI